MKIFKSIRKKVSNAYASLTLAMFMCLCAAVPSFAVYTEPAVVTAAKTDIETATTGIQEWSVGLGIALMIGWAVFRFIKKGTNKAIA